MFVSHKMIILFKSKNYKTANESEFAINLITSETCMSCKTDSSSV